MTGTPAHSNADPPCRTLSTSCCTLVWLTVVTQTHLQLAESHAAFVTTFTQNRPKCSENQNMILFRIFTITEGNTFLLTD